MFEEPEDPTSRSFFSEIISSISGIKFSNSGRHLITRDYLSVKVWDLNMDSKPVETYQVHEYLRSKLCSLYENDYIFDKFECCFSGDDRYVHQLTLPVILMSCVSHRLMMTGSYNNFFKIFDRANRRDVTFEASKDIIRPRVPLKPKKVSGMIIIIALLLFLRPHNLHGLQTCSFFPFAGCYRSWEEKEGRNKCRFNRFQPKNPLLCMAPKGKYCSCCCHQQFVHFPWKGLTKWHLWPTKSALRTNQKLRSDK